MTLRRSSALVLLLGLGACASGGRRGRGPTELELAPSAYCRVTAAEGLVDWNGTTATLCPGLVAAETEHDGLGGEGCAVHVVDGSGGLRPTGITGVRAAHAALDGRFVVWGWDGRLAIDDGRGGRTEVAPLALDPWLDAASGRLVYVAPSGEGSALEPGDDREVVLYDLVSGARTGLILDATAAAPVPIPGSPDVLYVSSATGVASIVRIGASALRTLTNEGATAVEQEFVPAYGRQLVFVDGGDRLIFAAEYESDTIWSLDLTTGEARELGPGRLPALGDDGSVLATNATGAECAAHYLEGRTP
jgi:hypothetical protein